MKGGMLMQIFTEDEIRSHVKINLASIREIEGAFTDLQTKDVQMPPILRVDIPANKEVDVKTAYIPGYDHFALKISSGFFNNEQLGLPSTGGLMILISAIHGQPEALLYDNGYLTDVRTAAAGAVAADYLANDTIATVGVIGAGAQARFQLEALQYVRDFKQVSVFSKTKTRLLAFKKEMEATLQVPVTIETNAEAVAGRSDLIITTTPATEAVLNSEWIRPGTHITAMGADAPYKQELDPEIMQMADWVVCDVIKQCAICGELRVGLKNKHVDVSKVMELGQITARKLKPRKTTSEITVADLTGTGAQDTRMALYAYERLLEKEVRVSP
jgi:ornithine cyclodeaminase